MNVGAELAQARDRLGLSRDDISTRTKISVERLLAIEQEDVAALPPLVYLKGFVREYAAAVSLDPEDVTRRYIAALDDVAGLMSATVPELPLAPTEHEFSPSAPPHIEQPRSAAATRSILGIDDMPRSPDTTRSILGIDDVPPVEALAPDAFPSEFEPVYSPVQARPRIARMAIVVVLAALSGFLLSSQAGRLSRWWSPTATSKAPVTSTASSGGDASRAAQPLPTDERPKPDEVSAASAPNDPDALRRDRQRDIAPAAPRTAPSAPAAPEHRTAPSASGSARPSAPGELRRDLAGAADGRGGGPVAPAPSAPSASASARPVPPGELRRDLADGLTGAWSLTARIEASDAEAFNNLNLAYRIQLQQDGDRITGRGLKWMENGKAIPARSQTPIEVEGIRRGDRVELRVTEHGLERPGTGTFVFDVGADGTLRGQFASTSDNSSGSSIARRVTPDSR
jgi:hypothetical protein